MGPYSDSQSEFRRLSDWRPPLGQTEAEAPREIFYLVTDILFLLGTIGTYLVQRDRVGWPGFLGFVFAASGLALIARPDGTILGLDVYALGSNVIGVGLLLLNLAMFKTKSLSTWAPRLWIASFVLGAGFLMAGAAILQSIARTS